MSSPLVKAESLKDQIYKLIKNNIVNNVYVDDQILNERAISEELQVSRTPVREALKALEADGWVEYIPYKGIVVKKIGLKELKDIFEIRRALEELMVELALPHMSPEALEALERCLADQRDMTESGDIHRFSASDTEFHNIILHATTNAMLKKSITDIRDKITRLGINSLLSGKGRFLETLDEHRRIIDALKNRNLEAARQAMVRHVQRVYETAHHYVLRRESGEKSAAT